MMFVVLLVTSPLWIILGIVMSFASLFGAYDDMFAVKIVKDETDTEHNDL